MTSLSFRKESIYTSTINIIDADFHRNQFIVLKKDKQQLCVEINQIPIMMVSTNNYLVRFTKNHFCLVELDLLRFYTLGGQLVSSVHVGQHIHELIPFQEGVICIYGDQGVFGDGLGQTYLEFCAA
ncbi:MAG: hypothetical protein KBT36_00560 [Kurthia sp.]|nr:hypothetical protein [Candidatus Kurthia equi]